MNETAAPHSESLGKRRYPSLLRLLGLKNDCYLWTSCWVSAPWVHPMRFSIWPSLWPWVTSMLQARKVRGRKHHWLAWNVQYGLICLILFKNVCRINKEKRSHALLALRNLCRVTCAVLELGWSRGPGAGVLRGIIGYALTSCTVISSWGSYRSLTTLGAAFSESWRHSVSPVEPELWQEGRVT